MNLRELIYKGFRLEFPNSEPLRNPDQGLQYLITDEGNMVRQPETSTPDVKGFVVSESPQQKRARLFETMTINTNIVDLKGRILVANVPRKIDEIVSIMVKNKKTYQDVSGTWATPIRWFHIALIHRMEGNLNFNTYLGNGQILDRKTTIVPKGRGPFSSFKAGAIDAIELKKLDLVKDWSIGNTLYILEGFNGYGYSDWKGINSPYLFSGSNQYTSGYYVADSVYSSTTVSQQIGIALIYKKLLEIV